MNPFALMKIKGMLEQFQANHPRVPLFFRDAMQHMEEGTVIEIQVTTKEGKNLCTNMKITRQDLELFEQLKSMSMQQ